MSEPGEAPEAPAAERDESGRGSGRSRRRTGCLASAVALLIAGAAHWAYWYRDRPHEMAPADSLLLGESAELPVRLWLPYPHQNLGALGKAVERPQEVLGAAARLAGLPEPTIPRLGAFGIPASRELLVATSRDGRTLEAAIRLYPAAAALTRLAGFVARNPWLGGGEVRVHDAPANVRWDGLTWHLHAGGAPPTGAAPTTSRDPRASAEEAPVLALVDLAEAAPPLAAGRYPLRREDGDLLVRLGAQLPDPPEPPRGSPPPGVMLLWLQRRAERAEALLLLEADREGILAGLPAAAAWAQPSGALDVLPGGSLLRQLAGVRASPFGGGELAATESSAATRARELAPVWLPLASGRSFPPLAVGGWLAIAPTAKHAQQLHDLLDEVPILGAAEAQRWGDVATVLHATRGYRTLSCWLAADGGSGELRLHH